MKTFLKLTALALVLSTIHSPQSTGLAQGTAFTYQGVLNNGANPASGVYDLRFAIYDAVSGGAQQGIALTNSSITVSNGLFTVTLDFGNQFPGAARWLEIGVRSNGVAAFSVLVPRQPLTPTPYAISANATNLVGTVSGSQIAPGSIGDTQLSNSVSLWNRSGADISYSAGNVGIGTSSPSTALDVQGTIKATSFIGTGVRTLPNSSGGPSVILGSAANYIPNGAIGATVSGGGATNYAGLNISNSATALFSTVGGGAGNIASGSFATVPGGNGNVASGGNSFAAGYGANATNNGAFVWADFTIGPGFSSTRDNQFLIRASGGVGIGTANPLTDFHVVASQYGASPAAIFESVNCGLPCAQQNYQENIRLLNSNPNGQTGIGFLTASGSARTNVPTAWIGTQYGCCFGNPSDLKFATRATTNLVDRMFINGISGNVGIGTTSPSTKLEVAGEITCVAVNITSDRNAKEEFKPVNPREVLAKVVGLPITEWQYKSQADARHIGPMAQDFRAAFTLGRDEKHITSVDADGVALAAIQGLNEKLEEKNQEVELLKQSVAKLTELVHKLAANQNGDAQ